MSSHLYVIVPVRKSIIISNPSINIKRNSVESYFSAVTTRHVAKRNGEGRTGMYVLVEKHSLYPVIDDTADTDHFF